MHVGFLDDSNSSVSKLVNKWQVALPLYENRGTKPNVFYIPPFLGPVMEDDDGMLGAESKIPLAVLEEMFGGNVKKTLSVLQAERDKKYKKGTSELMDILIGERSADMMLNPMT